VDNKLSLYEIQERQNLILHGEERQKSRFIPKPLNVIKDKLYELISHKEVKSGEFSPLKKLKK
jgi:hypothetical protein